METGLLAKTGMPLEHWIDVVKKSKLDKHKEIIDFLKSKHGFSYGFANFVAFKVRELDAGSIDDKDLIINQYKGKESMKPLYDKLISIIEKFGPDVKISPKKESVSLKRRWQFALIKPATKTRIDLGLKLKGHPITDRLENSGPFGTMCSHRVRVSSIKEIDDQLIAWLQEAYEKAK